VAPIVVTRLRDAASIEVDLDGLPADAAVAMPAGHVEQLVLNAKDALAGGGVIRVGARATDAAVVVTVADDRVGMTDDVVARIKPTGTGLGLATVMAIADAAGATISVMRPRSRHHVHRHHPGGVSPAGRGLTARSAPSARTRRAGGAARRSPARRRCARRRPRWRR
jgi:signal transduction histidine kinase